MTLAVRGRGSRREQRLAILAAPLVEPAYMVRIRDRAVLRARFRHVERALDVVERVVLDRRPRTAHLGRAQVDEPVLAHVERAGTGAALPVGLLAVGERDLE